MFVGDFHGDNIFGLDGRTGEIVSNTGFGGKICQAPGLSSNGMLYVGTSSPGGGSGGGSVNGAKVSPSGTFVADWTESQWRAGPGAPGDFGSFFGGVLVRADGSGTVYIADAQFVNDTGAVYKFTSGSPSMAGDWPTLGCGNRRQHKLRTYPYTLLELGAYPFGDAALAVVNSVDSLGRVVGYSHGQACGLAVNFYVAYWTSATPMIIGNCSTLSPYPVALAANLAGQVVGETFNGPIVWPSGFAGGSPQNLPLPPGLTGGEARDINASSNIIGSPTAAAILRLSSGRPMAHRGPRRKKKRGRKGVGPKH